eukprot:3028429-Rhodomonas_salina.1
MCAGVEAWWWEDQAPGSPNCCSRASGGAKKAGACVQGWRGQRLGIRRIRHQVAPKAAPVPQHCVWGGKQGEGALGECQGRSLPGWRLSDDTERVGGNRVKGHLESAKAGGECVRTSVLEPPRGIGGALRRLGSECRGGGLVSGGAGT